MLAVLAILAIVLAGCSNPSDGPTPVASDDGPTVPPPTTMSTATAAPKPATPVKPVVSSTTTSTDPTEAAPERNFTAAPNVIVAIPDTGFNPYHVAFYRPERTMHPCTYIEAYPCSIPALNLTVGTNLTYEQAVATDRAEWDAIEPGDVFWIPRTAFVAAACGSVYTDTRPESQALGALAGTTCILDDSINHGSSTSAAILRENPDALLAAVEGRPDAIDVLVDAGIPFDVMSVSWGTPVPSPPNTGTSSTYCSQNKVWLNPIPIFAAAGNEPQPHVTRCLAGAPHVIAITGGHVEPKGHWVDSAYTADFAATYWAELPVWMTIDGVETHGGTSLSTPMAAGAASLAILEVRRATGFTGNLNHTTGILDPIHGLTTNGLRHALNVSASYDPEVPANQGWAGAYGQMYLLIRPMTPGAPWTNWGWGWLDAAAGRTAATCILDGVCEAVDSMAEAYMEAQITARRGLYQR